MPGSRRTSGVVAGLIGFVVLAALWETGATVIRATSQNPEKVWPSLSYVIGTALPEIGEVGAASGAGGTIGGIGEPGLAGDAPLAPSESQPSGGERGSYTAAAEVLARESAVTVRRVVLGTLMGAALGIALGLAMGLSSLIRRMIYPIFNVVRQIPLLALTLLFLVWFAGAERGIYAFVIFGVSTMLAVNTMDAVRNVPLQSLQYARTFGARHVRLIRTVVLPAITPELLAGIKVAFGLAWAMVLAAEYLGTQSGLGRLMLLFESFGFTGRMVVILALFVFWALLLHGLVTAAGNRLTRWVPRAREGG